MKLTFKKYERLKSKKLIAQLYEHGFAFNEYPLRIIFLPIKHESKVPILTGITVSKRFFKNAVDRNRLKRLMREAYRHQKPNLYQQTSDEYICMISYIGKRKITYQEIFFVMEKLLKKFVEHQNTKHEN
ncbi:MAG: ribonuclease P protein component [Polaribacter sp.]|nr:ribonuclease P protein component [Polaribacter sp.]